MNKPENNLTEAGREEIMTATIGFNFKFIRSIWDLFRRPSEYFQAAKTPNWQNRYTPSFTILIGISAIIMALDFIWAREDGSYMKAMAQQTVDKNGTPLSDNPEFMKTLTELVGFANVISTPIYIGLIIILAWLFRAWGEKLPFVVRLRYLVATVIPGTILGSLIIFASPISSTAIYMALTYLFTFAMFAAVFITSLRGAYHALPSLPAIGRSTLLTGLIIILTFTSMTIALGISTLFYVDDLKIFMS